MKTITLFLSIFILSLTFSNAQSDTIRNLKLVTSYYENGNLKTVESFLEDSCYLYEPSFGDIILSDTCRCGIFRAYYSNGMLKTLGQYDCKWWTADSLDTFIEDCFKTGIWYQYDSTGKVSKVKKYKKGYLLAVKFPVKRDTLKITQDSTKIRLKPYEVKNSYLIKRSADTKYLTLEFPITSNHNYWFVFNQQLDLFLEDKNKSVHLVKSFKYDDTPNNTKILDVSNWKNGSYYIYHRSFMFNFMYEVEIILTQEEEDKK